VSAAAPAGLPGEVRVVSDPPAAYAELVAGALSDRGDDPANFRLAISGGASGIACLNALIAARLPWDEIELFFADERCVEATDPRSNAGSLGAVLGELRGRLAGWHPMSCRAGPEAYERELREAGGLDLAQLGFGPDGHTASLFPGSPGLDAAPGALVVLNHDLSGKNPLERMTLTLEGIATAATVVIVVSGADKRDALARLVAGEDLPPRRVHADKVVWLVDEAAAEGLRDQLAPPR